MRVSSGGPLLTTAAAVAPFLILFVTEAYQTLGGAEHAPDT